MRASKLTLFLSLLGALALAGCAPGSSHTSTNPNAKLTSLRIKDYEVTSPAPTTFLVENAATAQQVYNKAVALPVAPKDQNCLAFAGARDELTFLEGEQVIATAMANREGCPMVIFGSTDVRLPDQPFWQLLDQVIAEATPPAAQPDRTEVVSFTGLEQPPTLAAISSADQAKQLYDALRALPELPGNTSCDESTGKHYTLVFFEGIKRYQAELDENGCVSGPTNPDEHHQAYETFWQLLKQTLASVPTETARPDLLNLKIEPVASDPSTGTASEAAIINRDIIQKLYDAIYALPEFKSASTTCPAGAGTVYGLSFSRDGIELLSALADRGGCGTVTYQGSVRLANQAFWDLLKQAQTA